MVAIVTLLSCTHRAPAHPPIAAPAIAPAIVPTLDEPGLAALLRNPGDAVLVVSFWATWCRPCVEELALLATAAAAHPDVRFALVSVDDARDVQRVRTFVATHDHDLPYLHLVTDDTPEVLGRNVVRWPDIIPVTLVLEPGGATRIRFDGTLDADELDRSLR